MQSGNQIDPKNLFARISARNDLSPRWGGSFDVLDGMAQQSSKTLPSQSARDLQYNLVVAKARHQEVIEKSKPQAHALCKQAQTLCENSSAARDGISRTYP